jgi:hypothetical protein
MRDKIVRHQELDVYKKAFETSMQIFELSKIFQEKKLIHSQIRFVVHHDQYVPILLKLGENVVMKQRL